jgi:glycosyltransferase involved in cell wall biosynthesis
MKEIQLNIEKMRRSKIFLATPMYGGMCHGMYTRSLAQTIGTAAKHGLQLQLYYLFNESLITRARNYAVSNFLKSDSEYLLFIDSDISWEDQDLLYMFHLMVEQPEKYRILTAMYPKKAIAWEKVLHAAKSGAYDNNPAGLEQVAGDMVFNPLPGIYENDEVPVYEPVQIKEAGTGFMMIHRSVFEEMEAVMPDRKYTPDHIREGISSEQITAFFDCVINEENRYLSEDYMFCANARTLGINIYTLPFINLTHTGSYIYKGNLIEMANAGVHASIDHTTAEQLRRTKTSGNNRPEENSS